jgi:hypothetical protein
MNPLGIKVLRVMLLGWITGAILPVAGRETAGTPQWGAAAARTLSVRPSS